MILNINNNYNQNKDLISVVVPVYNVEKYLGRCIDSILKQTYNKIEILLIDDGSTDSCSSICDLYKERDTRVKVVHKNNGGLSSARNVGLDIAKGDYVTFVDSDDFIHPQMLEVMYLLLKETKTLISIVNYDNVYDNNVVYEKLRSFPYDVMNSHDAILCSFRYGYFTISCAKLYRKELFNEIRFPLGIVNEDEAITYKLFWKSENVSVTKTSLYYYFQRSGSIMGSYKQINNTALVCIFKERIAFFERIGWNDLVIEQAKSIMNYYCDKYLRYHDTMEKEVLELEHNTVKDFFVIYGHKLKLRQYIKCFLYYISPKLLTKFHKIIFGKSD